MKQLTLSLSGGKRRVSSASYMLACALSLCVFGVGKSNSSYLAMAPIAIAYTNCLELGDSVNIPVMDLFQYTGPSDFHINDIGQPKVGEATISTLKNSIRYKASASHFAIDSFWFELCDQNNDCDQNWIFIHYIPANQISTSCDYGSAFMNQLIRGNVLYNDYNYDLRPLVVSTSFLVQPVHGEVQLSENGNYIYRPENGFTGKDHFYYLACTAGSPRYCEKNIVNLSIEEDKITCRNVIAAYPDCLEIAPFGQAQINLLANDKNLSTAGLLVETKLITAPQYGNATLDNSGIFSYDHQGSVMQEDKAEYQICIQSHSCSVCDTAKISIKIEDALYACQNMRASLIDDQQYCCKGHSIVGNIFRNDVDHGKNATSARVDLSLLPKNGTIKEGANGDYIYTPNPGFCGVDEFGYIVCFANGDCDRSTVRMQIYDKLSPALSNDEYDVNTVNCQLLELENNDLFLDGFNWNSFQIISGGESGNFFPFSRGVEYCPLGQLSRNDTVMYSVLSEATPCQVGMIDTGIILLRVRPFLSISHNFNLNAELSERGVELSWNPLDSEKNQSVIIQKSVDKNQDVIYNDKNDAGIIIDTDCVNGKTYLYRIGSKDEKTTYFSNWVSISTNAAKIDQPFVINQRLLCPLVKLTNVTVSSINGQTVRKMNSIKECVHLGDLPSGIYVLQFRTENKVKSKLIYL